MSKVIKHTKLTDTLAITECKDGFWLYDKVRGMNLAMKADTEQAAFTKAIMYYQDRLPRKEKELKELQSKVKTFVNQFIDKDEDIF